MNVHINLTVLHPFLETGYMFYMYRLTPKILRLQFSLYSLSFFLYSSINADTITNLFRTLVSLSIKKSVEAGEIHSLA